jgi:hypothetical protein
MDPWTFTEYSFFASPVTLASDFSVLVLGRLAAGRRYDVRISATVLILELRCQLRTVKGKKRPFQQHCAP